MSHIKLFKGSLIIICLHLVGVIYFAINLPDIAQIPMHWNFSGEIDKFAGKWEGLITGLGFNLGLFIMMLVFPSISPKYQNSKERYEHLLPALSMVMTTLLGTLHLYSLWISNNPDHDNQYNLSVVIVGFLMIFLGNLLPKTPKNFFIGIKTPWSLSSDEIWHKTHRLGGKMFILAGFTILSKSILLNHSTYQLVMAILSFIFLFIPIAYSFILYLKERKSQQFTDDNE